MSAGRILCLPKTNRKTKFQSSFKYIRECNEDFKSNAINLYHITESYYILCTGITWLDLTINGWWQI
jgi:hypothetical protein